MEVINFCAALVILCYFNITDGKQFRFDYNYHKEAGGWLKLHVTPVNWTEAYLTCYHEGGVLASPEDINLAAAMKLEMANNKMQTTCGIHTGVHATFAKGHYFSVEGTPLSKIPVLWAPNEPDNDGDAEDCLHMFPDGTMADVNCSIPYPFICYKRNTNGPLIGGCGIIEKGYELDVRTGSCYKFHTVPQTWSTAFATCADEGGYLAIINSDTEAQVIKDLFAKYPSSSLTGKRDFTNYASIGFKDFAELRMTIHGQSLEKAGYAAWNTGHPEYNHTVAHFCGVVGRDGLLQDSKCSFLFPFICEKNPDSLLADDK